MNKPTDILSYHKSISAELSVLRDRLRQLIQHRPTDGGFKEAALRAVLRRHLPETFNIGTGFIFNSERLCSTQIDILIVDRSSPTLFKDGDLLVVTPDAVRGILEVKTSISGRKEIDDAINKLLNNKMLCSNSFHRSQIFTGLFVFDGKENQAVNIIESVRDAANLAQQRVKKATDPRPDYIDAIACGMDLFGCYQKSMRTINNQTHFNVWSIWKTPGMAPSYFIGSILTKGKEGEVSESGVWWPSQEDNNRLRYIHSGTDGTIYEVIGESITGSPAS